MVKFNFTDSGKGIPLVMIHGFCESNKIWQDLTATLSREYRIICPDLPGFGKTDPFPENFSLEQIGDLLINWLDGLAVQKPVIIGHSLGGYIALEILRKYPEEVSAIGLFNSSVFEDSADKKENRNKLIQFLHTNGVAPFIKTFVPSLFYPPTAELHQKIIDQISVEGRTIHPSTVAGYAAAMRDRRDSLDLLGSNKDRILLIAGEYDQNVPLDKSLEMAKYLNDDHVHIIPDSAHMSLFEQPEMCYKAVSSFAKRFAV